MIRFLPLQTKTAAVSSYLAWTKRIAFAGVGVYDAQDLQKKVMEYCEQMTPIIRPVFTVCDEDGKVFVSAEIPPVDST